MKTSTPSKRLLAMAALALIGVGVTLNLSQHYYDFRNGSAAFKSFCNLSEGLNCDVVAASRFSELIGGFPLSAFACGSFAAVFIVALIARNAFWRREAIRAAFLLSLNGLLFSAIYFSVMAFVLKTFCLFCLITDVLSVGLFGLALSLKPEWIQVHKPDFSKWKILLTTIGVSVLAMVVGTKAALDVPVEASLIDNAAQGVINSPVMPVDVTGASLAIGPVTAPITIVEFSDFQCPFCRNAAMVVNSLVHRYPGKIRVVFRNFPLDSACNRSLQRPMHPFACAAAKAAWCAQRQGKFQAVYESLFDQQDKLSGGVEPIAITAGIEGTSFQTCMNSNEPVAAILKDIEDGIRLGISSTPTFFVNGHKLEGALPVPVWTRIIDHFLANSR